MFKRLYAIGAHEDFSPPNVPYQIFAAVWYGEYQGVVQAVPHRGIESTTPWYREYHAVVFQPIALLPHIENDKLFYGLHREGTE